MISDFDFDEKCNPVFWKTAESKKRYTFNQGGTRSGKTYAMMQFIYFTAYNNSDKPHTFSVVSESLPHLKKGAIKDFLDFLKLNKIYNEKHHNKTDNKYMVGDFTIEFFSAGDSDKVHGAGRDYLFVNEIQNIQYEVFFQLIQRTNIRVYADYNPTHDFFIFDKFIENADYKDDITFIKSTLLDNRFVSPAIKKDVITRAARDENYKKVYLDGEKGSLEGLIFQFKQVPKVPDYFILKGAGLDFGFTNDPTTIPAIYKHPNKNIICIDELCYQTGLSNEKISQIIDNSIIGKTFPVIADSAEPKSIAELKDKYHVNVFPCEKGADSVNYGIGVMQEYEIWITESSLNAIMEFRNYHWLIDKNGKSLNIPVDNFNHLIDAARYAITKLIGMPVKDTKNTAGTTKVKIWG